MLAIPSFLLPAAVLLGALQNVLAQTTTTCNPLNTTGCPTDPAFGTDYNFVFNTTPAEGAWETTAGTVDYTDNGAEFTINAKGDSPTIRTKFYIFFGRVELWWKVAPGQGIISSMMLLSDDLDEIDWEFLGGNGTAVETNYFGKGKGNYTWERDYIISGGTTEDYHNYTIDWTNSSLNWYIDGEHVRHLTPEDANNTHSYPESPMRLSLGIWAGGDPDEPIGTIEWAGGETDYTKGPFTMYVKSCHVTDYGSGTAYNYTDMSGSWQSIQEIGVGSNSTAAKAVNAVPEKSISEKFSELSSGSKAAIYACSAAAAAGLVGYAAFYCFRQRKQGQQEAAMAARMAEEERVELERYKAAGVNPDGFSDVAPTPNEKYGASSRPLLNEGASRSPPGTPQGRGQNPYSDGFSAI
ncbi:putative glycosidase crf1 [Cytospora mali]|uniref:chitinase n=1 Tax=Cytospora mali TaxID=578113 RepID=A0A194VJC0_CYTMA|nr:putative glycosidase crf1 [Valsa mali]